MPTLFGRHMIGNTIFITLDVMICFPQLVSTAA